MTKTKKIETAKELAEKIKKAKEPIYIEKLELGDGEVYVGNMPEGDKAQLLMRNMNKINIGLNQHTLLLSTICICLQEICKKNGIDIDSIIDNIK